MNLFYTILVIFYYKIVYCDWVEITKVKDKHLALHTDFPILYSSTIQKPSIFTTTPSSYEIVMRTPFYYETPLTTTVASKATSRKGGNLELTTVSSDIVIPRSATTENSNRSNVSKNEDEEKIKDEQNKNDDNSGFSNFVPLIQSIQKRLLQNKENSVTGKISILKNLRDTLLANIGDKMSKLWDPTEDGVESRGYKDDHHMDFPSNEGALMTIGFLTFAVFLIKLVLKLIYALKYKQQYYYTTTTTPATLFIRRQRDVSEDENTRILQLIEEFRFD